MHTLIKEQTNYNNTYLCLQELHSTFSQINLFTYYIPKALTLLRIFTRKNSHLRVDGHFCEYNLLINN